MTSIVLSSQMVYSIRKDVLDTQYRGCGRGWAAINQDGEVVGIRYMEAPLEKVVDASAPLGFRFVRPEFASYRATAKAELAALGTVVSGTYSCTEFIA